MLYFAKSVESSCSPLALLFCIIYYPFYVKAVAICYLFRRDVFGLLVLGWLLGAVGVEPGDRRGWKLLLEHQTYKMMRIRVRLPPLAPELSFTGEF